MKVDYKRLADIDNKIQELVDVLKYFDSESCIDATLSWKNHYYLLEGAWTFNKTFVMKLLKKDLNEKYNCLLLEKQQLLKGQRPEKIKDLLNFKYSEYIPFVIITAAIFSVVILVVTTVSIGLSN